MKGFRNFLDDLGNYESGGNYKAVNKFGYLGKYQMGEAALVDAGYYKKEKQIYNNDWHGIFLGTDNVYSKYDFLNNPKAQENAQFVFKKKQWQYLKSVGADKYIGHTVKGIGVTASGLLAACHLKGAVEVIKFLKSMGEYNSADAFGTSISKYLKLFAGYDVKEITS